MKKDQFPDIKGLIIKRTKSGQRFLLHDKDYSGKDIYVTVPIMDNDSDKDYLRKIKEARIKLNSKKNGITITELLYEYSQKKQLARETYRHLKQNLMGFSLNNANNEKVIKDLINSELKRSTLKTVIGNIRSFFRWLILTNRVEGIKDPTSDVVLKHVTSIRTRTLTEEEDRIFNENVKDEPDPELKLMLLLAYHTGARISSILALTPTSNKDNKIYYFNVKTKKNYDYPIPIYDESTISLFNTLAIRGFIFSKSYSCMQHKAWMWLYRLFGKDQKGETISLHSLRHTFATKAIQNGVEPEIVSRLLDHSSPAITLKIYGKHSQQQLEDAIMKMSRKKE